LLGNSVTVRTGGISPDGVAASQFVISCAGWLPDARWQEIDRWCQREKVPWHMCYAEGRKFYIGPCALPGATASYADTRARRLAACGLADELLAFWSYLDAGTDLPPVPWPGAGGIAIIAGLLATDVLAHLAGQTLPSEGFQVAFDPATASIQYHPVLLLPEIDSGSGDESDS
jgi:hypothetical protein